jgi:hypothetical protein
MNQSFYIQRQLKRTFSFLSFLILGLPFASISQSGNGYFGPYFRHISSAANSIGDWSNFDNSNTNGNTGALVQITPCYNPNNVYNNFNFGAYYSSSNKWSVYTELATSIPVGSSYNVAVPNVNGTSFKHIAASSTIVNNWTVLNNASSNNNANALVFVTRDYNASGNSYNNKTRGVWYSAGKWNIYNEDISAFKVNDAFNVFVTNPGANAFVHKATAANTTGHVTYIDNPKLNGNPNAQLIISHNWSAPAGNVYNNHPTGVWYNSVNGRWSVYNQDLVAMPVNASFNILIANASADCGGGSTVSNVKLNNGTNNVAVAPGASVNLKLDYSVSNATFSQTAIQQIVIGIGTTPLGCAYNGIPSVCPQQTTGTYNLDFIAPTTPGNYAVYRKGDLQFNCQNAQNNFAGDPNKVQIGTVTVVPTGGASVTFKVNIDDYISSGAIIAPNGIRIAGNFAARGAYNGVSAMVDWTPTAATGAMTNVSGNIYEISITYPAGSQGQVQQFKFVNGDWGAGNNEISPALISCGVDDGSGNINRAFIIPANNTTVVYCWDQCASTCPGVTEIKENDAAGKGMDVFPNPATHESFIRFFSESGSSPNIQILDVQGKVVQEVSADVAQPGVQFIPVSLQNLKNGLYFVKLQSEGKPLEIKRFVVSK